ncbi:MAG: hypothetical protein R3250_15150, partial [Melioribacteraceae bacterium]|nr:hypothetical protein [Melioribacteraceae bacterium]
LEMEFFPGNTQNQLFARIKANWITSLMNYQTEHDFKLVKKAAFWYLQAETAETRIPPDQLFQMPDMRFYIQGRRKISEKKLLKEDVLDRPEVLITSANLIERNGQFHIVGEIFNADNVPAFVLTEAVLYDQNDREIIRNTSKDIISRNILPGENTPFRIDFADVIKSHYSNSSEIERINPVKFVLYVRTMTIDAEFYRYTGIKNLQIKPNNQISGDFINFGDKEVIIPQILTQWTNSSNDIMWVDKVYLPYGVKQQRKKEFSIEVDQLQDVQFIQLGKSDQYVVNGVSMNNSIYNNRLDNYKANWMKTIHQNKLGFKINAFTESIYAE